MHQEYSGSLVKSVLDGLHNLQKQHKPEKMFNLPVEINFSFKVARR